MTRKVASHLLGKRFGLRFLVLALCVSTIFARPLYALDEALEHTDIVGPAGSEQFGQKVFVLDNGNFVVIDPLYDKGTVQDVGAVYLYDGATLAQITMLTGSSTGDLIGSHGITKLPDGNFYVYSVYWNNGTILRAGALTWINASTGLSGVVSADNSLVGTATTSLGSVWVTPLANKNHVVSLPYWTNPVTGEQELGAVTWVQAGIGIMGELSPATSLVGGQAFDQVGYVYALTNGNYVVVSWDWQSAPGVRVGAVTWGNGTTGTRGEVTAANSLVGTRDGDISGVWPEGYLSKPLYNGNFVLAAPMWDNDTIQDAGAVVIIDGEHGTTGVISPETALVGSTAGDHVGSVILRLQNGSLVAVSYQWDNLDAEDAGALTWMDGVSGVTGAVSEQNSLVGDIEYSRVGSGEASWYDGLQVGDGALIVQSPNWNEGRGATTWLSGTDPLTGTVSAENSLVGASILDSGTSYVLPLENGNYVVVSRYWDSGAIADVGAYTWGNGTTGVRGVISADNSLIGVNENDGLMAHTSALKNGNYVVASPYWDNGSTENVGGVRWVDGSIAVTGTIEAADSLVGARAWDMVGRDGIFALTNGNYVVVSSQWEDTHLGYRGAVTLGNGLGGTTGTISVNNSLVGPATGPGLGSTVVALTNCNYVVASPGWDLGKGAVTFGNGITGVTGAVSVANSLVGSTERDEFFDLWPDHVGSEVYSLSTGNYLVVSPDWNNRDPVTWQTIGKTGAITVGDGENGTVGEVSADNSVVATTYDDVLGWYYGTEILPDGEFLVISRQWENGANHDAGAVTWGHGDVPVVGTISRANSILGVEALNGAGINAVYNPIYEYMIVGRPIDNTVTVAKWTEMTTHVPLPLLQR